MQPTDIESLPTAKYDLHNINVRFTWNRTTELTRVLVEIGEQYNEGVRSLRNACEALSERTNLPLHGSSAWLIAFSGEGRAVNEPLIDRAVAAYIDETINIHGLSWVIQVEYSFPPDIADIWALCLLGYEQALREKDESARTAGKHFCMLCDAHKKESELVHGYLCPTHKHPTQELKG